jgi:hypothetical protein
MTKRRVALPASVVAEQEPFFIALGGPKAHDSYGRKIFPEKDLTPRISPLRSFGAPGRDEKGEGGKTMQK